MCWFPVHYPFLYLAWFLKTSLVTLCWDSWRIPLASNLEKPSDLGLVNPHPQMKAFNTSTIVGSRGDWKSLSDPRGASRQRAISSRVRSVCDWMILLLEEQMMLPSCHFQKSLGATVHSHFRVVMGSRGWNPTSLDSKPFTSFMISGLGQHL